MHLQFLEEAIYQRDSFWYDEIDSKYFYNCLEEFDEDNENYLMLGKSKKNEIKEINRLFHEFYKALLKCSKPENASEKTHFLIFNSFYNGTEEEFEFGNYNTAVNLNIN